MVLSSPHAAPPPPPGVSSPPQGGAMSSPGSSSRRKLSMQRSNSINLPSLRGSGRSASWQDDQPPALVPLTRSLTVPEEGALRGVLRQRSGSASEIGKLASEPPDDEEEPLQLLQPAALEGEGRSSRSETRSKSDGGGSSDRTRASSVGPSHRRGRSAAASSIPPNALRARRAANKMRPSASTSNLQELLDDDDDEEALPSLTKSEHLCAVLYKRRGGFGSRMGEQSWVKRCFTLYGPVLCYYESADVESMDPSRPRGRLHLTKEDTWVEMTVFPADDFDSSTNSGSRHLRSNSDTPLAAMESDSSVPDTFSPSSKFSPNKFRSDNGQRARLEKISQMPTPFLLTVHLSVLGAAKRKWEMCCPDRPTLEAWYHAIHQFDGRPIEPRFGASFGGGGGGAHDRHAIDGASTHGGASLSALSKASAQSASVLPKSLPRRSSNSASSLEAGGAQSSPTLTSSPRRKRVDIDDRVEVIGPSELSTNSFDEESSAPAETSAATVEDSSSLSSLAGTEGKDGFFAALYDGEVILCMLVVNTALYLARNGGAMTFWVALCLLNATVLHLANRSLVEHATTADGTPTARRTSGASAPMVKTMTSVTSALKSSGRRNSADKSATTTTTAPPPPRPAAPKVRKIRSAGSTTQRAKPVEGSPLEEIVQRYGPESAEAMRAYSERAVEGSDDTVPHCYCNTKASAFSLRIGPNYKKNKTKAPSLPALYDLFALDVIRSSTVLRRVQDAFSLPNVPGITDITDTGNPHVPPMIVVNMWIPTEDPGTPFRRAPTDGPSYIVVFYFLISEATLQALKSGNLSPALRLFCEWCRRGEHELDFRGRFKAMGYMEDIENSGIPSFLTGYNGKPTLVVKSGTFTRYSTHIEMSVNTHMWTFFARKGLNVIQPYLPKFVANFGFTIEGRSDDELPEVLLGGCRFCHADLSLVDEEDFDG